MKEYGVKYLLTRTVGYNHIDLKKAHELGFEMAYVPGYSPNAVSELAVSMGNGLLRNLFYSANHQQNHNFKIADFMFAKEIRKAFLPLCTILILSHKCWEKPIYGLLPTFLNQT
ncbi:hypothetical protein [Spiroplasma endosymbiont of Apeira syringaria]|uniref:hypothetical protein n=1 Tax=Spiroplasma endosymbiont of Apeira syringaria TaxID=3066307 RepID=UPI0030CCAEE0